MNVNGKSNTTLNYCIISNVFGTSLVAQWLRLCASTAGGAGLVPGQGAGISRARWCSQNNKNKKSFTSYFHPCTKSW